MSSSLLVSVENNSRQLVVRPARVWQAVDLLHPVAPPGGFMPSAWQTEVAPQFGLVDFDLQTLRLMPPPLLAGIEGASPQANDVSEVLDEVMPLPVASAAALAQARDEGYEQGVQDTRAAMQGEMKQVAGEAEYTMDVPQARDGLQVRGTKPLWALRAVCTEHCCY